MDHHGAAELFHNLRIILSGKPFGVEGGGDVFRAVDRAFQIGAQLVDAADKDAALRAEQRTSDAVAGAVDINDLAVFRQAVGGAEINVRRLEEFTRLEPVPVDSGVSGKGFRKTQLFERH